MLVQMMMMMMTLALAAEAGIAAGGFSRIPGLARIPKIATMVRRAVVGSARKPLGFRSL
jgi:hypothetical protein